MPVPPPVTMATAPPSFIARKITAARSGSTRAHGWSAAALVFGRRPHVARFNPKTPSGCALQAHSVAEALEATDGAALDPVPVALIEVAGAEVLVGGVVEQDVVDAR